MKKEREIKNSFGRSLYPIFLNTLSWDEPFEENALYTFIFLNLIGQGFHCIKGANDRRYQIQQIKYNSKVKY